MLIDSSASLTLINIDIFYRLPERIRRRARYLTTNLQLQLADESCLWVQMTLLLPITIANCTIRHVVYVVPQLWRPCIIGNDFIQKHNLQIDGGRQQVYFQTMNEKKLNIPSRNRTSNVRNEYTLLATERIKLPSFHAFDIQVRSDKEFIEG
jgi:hypothetical protein